MIALFELFNQDNFHATMIALVVCVAAAFIWVIYMMQLVTNEEEIAERIRSEMRRIEEERRIREDQKRNRQQQERDFLRSLSDETNKKMNETENSEKGNANTPAGTDKSK